jgi:hypothetical protein
VDASFAVRREGRAGTQVCRMIVWQFVTGATQDPCVGPFIFRFQKIINLSESGINDVNENNNGKADFGEHCT